MEDYEFKTTFWQDFTIAEHYGLEAIEDTYERAFNEWKDNYVYLTELVLVLNWKIWQWYDTLGDCAMARLYNGLWKKAQDYGYNNLKDEELTYFWRTLD